MTDEKLKALIKKTQGPAIRKLAKLYKRNVNDILDDDIFSAKEEIVEKLIQADAVFDELPWIEIEHLVEELAY